MTARRLGAALILASSLATFACSSRGPSPADAGDDGAVAEDSGAPVSDAAGDATDSGVDAGARDAGADASPPFVTALSIASARGTPLQGAPGDAITLVVVLTLSDGTTQQAFAGDVTWLAPLTVVAEDPYDAGPDIVPEAGAEPTAFYVRNDYHQSSPGTLYIVDRGSVSSAQSAQVIVSAQVADAGLVSASVAILAAPTGDPDAGGRLFQQVLLCNGCHGATGGGSPLALLPDGGPALLDGGPVYLIAGQQYPYPAPGLNAVPGSGHLAVDPAWNAALLAMAAQSDMDNKGVALRVPMPMWLGGNNGTGNPLNAQNFADIYAWLKTQTQ